MKLPRIALFSDSHHDANNLARTTLAIEACARRRNIPLLSVHPGSETTLVNDGSIVRLGLKRSGLLSIGSKHGPRFDLSMWRHAARVAETVRWFAPDVLHFTAPSGIGQLGASLGRRLKIPVVASWDTSAEAHKAKWALMRFYGTSRVVPTFPTSSGADTEMFTPARRRGANAIVNIGYVGRLSAEMNVKLLHRIESQLDAEGLDVRFTLVGDGDEGEWLRRHMLRAQFTGPLRGEALADAYAQMDILAFPSECRTAGQIVLEAMASGVPAVVMSPRGQPFVVHAEQTAIVANGADVFVDGVRTLVRNRGRREAMGIAARARAIDLLSWDRTFIDICTAYEAAISPSEGEDSTGWVLSPA